LKVFLFEQLVVTEEIWHYSWVIWNGSAIPHYYGPYNTSCEEKQTEADGFSKKI